jgi:rod shape-determining protein MreB
MYSKFLSLFSKDMAIDLGTTQTCVYVRNAGVVVRESSVVAVRRDSRGGRKIVAVGDEAKRMLGRTPSNIVATRPLQDGAIADFDTTQAMLQHFISKIHNRSYGLRPHVVVSVPPNITDIEKRAVQEAVYRTKARRVFLIEEPMAAAIGAGLPVVEPKGSMVLDIGGGTTKVAIISLAGIVYSSSMRVGGNKLDETILNYIKRRYNLLIGQDSAEQIKKDIGSAYPGEHDHLELEVKGRDSVLGRPSSIRIGAKEIRDAMWDDIRNIVYLVRAALEQTPPDLAADVIDDGIVLTGGGALLKGLDQLIRQEISLPVHVAEEPLYTVVTGAGMLLDDLELLQQAVQE